MSSGDRVAVPTNGHRPALHDDALDSPHHDASGSEDRPAGAESAERGPAERGPAGAASESPEVGSGSPASASSSAALPMVTASQVVAGVGVLAAVALLLLGRRRGRG